MFTTLALLMHIAGDAPPAPPFTLSGYVETSYAWNFNVPSNGITSFRGFDNRHNSITLENAELQASWDVANVVGVIALQVGATPATYYLAEPSLAGGGGANPTNGALFQTIQQANVGYRFPILGGLLVQGGVFLSPVGPEGVAIKDDWSWSRSDLFFGLPFYHAGVHAVLALDEHWSAMAMLCNGWNDIVDNNDGKSFTASLNYTQSDVVTAQLLYFGGPERAKGAPEGDGSWRNLVDVFATWTPVSWLGLQAQLDGGVELNRFGASDWRAAALTARVQPTSFLFVAARGDVFHEDAASSGDGTASHIFWPASTVGSGTVTLDARPAEHVSFRLEYRHDQADAAMFFTGDVAGDGTATPFVPNAHAQDTLTLGAVAWF